MNMDLYACLTPLGFLYNNERWLRFFLTFGNPKLHVLCAGVNLTFNYPYIFRYNVIDIFKLNRFTIVAVLGHNEFPKQTGTTKKEAERKAAVAALRSLKERRLYHMGGASSNSSVRFAVCKTFLNNKIDLS